jgi:protein ImuB
VVSPLSPSEALEDYVHLDFPVSLASLLLHQVQKSVDFLFARLQGRRLVASRLELTLRCEFSSSGERKPAEHKIVIEPTTANRDRELYLTLLENRLSSLDLDNPIRDFELRVSPTAEKSRQLDFFEPRTNETDKVDTLISLLSQPNGGGMRPGFYRISPAILPENGWRLAGSGEAFPDTLSPSDLAFDESEVEGVPAVAPQPHYGAAVMRAPRPTRILREPVPLPLDELERMKILSTNPIERIEGAWWNEYETRRDYYFAISAEGQCLWIYQDRRSEEYFLHGYFD